MHMMGLSTGAFWTAEAVKSIVIAAAVSISQVIAVGLYKLHAVDYPSRPLLGCAWFQPFSL
jgi:hypothetical protein